MDYKSAAFMMGPLSFAIAAIAPALGISLMTSAFFNSAARQPEVIGRLSMYYFITLGAVEALGIFGLVVFFVTLGKVA
jgi:F-type H+-transporting ATPase subunit c